MTVVTPVVESGSIWSNAIEEYSIQRIRLAETARLAHRLNWGRDGTRSIRKRQGVTVGQECCDTGYRV